MVRAGVRGPGQVFRGSGQVFRGSGLVFRGPGLVFRGSGQVFTGSGQVQAVFTRPPDGCERRSAIGSEVRLKAAHIPLYVICLDHTHLLSGSYSSTVWITHIFCLDHTRLLA